MKFSRFQVLVEVIYHIPYRVSAESREEAEQIARDMARDGEGLGNADLVGADVLDVVDESNEE